jgi:ribosomal protein S18 acetylase RimI-like enzyme
MGEYHARAGECWYLPLIGVDPIRQARGVGARLMAEALRRIDASRSPAYLESSNPRNVTLYERHGFERMGRIQVGSSPPMLPMYRPPRG